MKAHIKITLALVASLMASTAWAQNGTWDAYPGQSAIYSAAVQPPINADGSSNFKAKNGTVIPVKFALLQGVGSLVFESIGSDNDPDNDYSYLSFTPNATVTFNQITQLSAVYSFAQGNCGGGSLRWSVRVSPTQSVFIYYGDYPSFGNCTSPTQSGTNLIGLSDLRYDTSQVGGTFYDTYAHAQALIGNTPIIRVSLVLDSGWQANQIVNLTSATVATAAFTDTFTPQAAPPTPVCPTQQALFGYIKQGTTPSGDVNEAMTIQPQDNDGVYRTVDCKYMYNLATSSLMGTGTYDVYATIDGTTFHVATFDLK